MKRFQKDVTQAASIADRPPTFWEDAIVKDANYESEIVVTVGIAASIAITSALIPPQQRKGSVSEQALATTGDMNQTFVTTTVPP